MNKNDIRKCFIANFPSMSFAGHFGFWEYSLWSFYSKEAAMAIKKESKKINS